MKERSLLYFITAVVTTMLFLVSILITTQRWFDTYGVMAMPSWYMFLIPVILLWVGWYLDITGYLLASSIILSILLGGQFDYTGLVNGSQFVPSLYAPMVRTVYVLGLMLLIGSSGLGYFTFHILHGKKK